MLKGCFVTLSLGMVLSLSFLLFAKTAVCHEQKDQNSQNQCIENQYIASQKILDEWVAKVIKEYFNDTAIFTRQYQSWMQFRAEHCAAQTAEWGSGSMASFIYMSCMDRLTQAKIQEFKAIVSYGKNL